MTRISGSAYGGSGTARRAQRRRAPSRQDPDSGARAQGGAAAWLKIRWEQSSAGSVFKRLTAVGRTVRCVNRAETDSWTESWPARTQARGRKRR